LIQMTPTSLSKKRRRLCVLCALCGETRMPNEMNIQAFIDSLEKEYVPQALEAGRIAVGKFVEYVLGQAQVLCPVDCTKYAKHRGFLKASAVAEEAITTGTGWTCTFGFGADYAVFVHEILENKHPQGQAKFLETAMRANAAKLPQFVLSEMQAKFG